MQNQLPAPTASGSLSKTPFLHLLVYALERRLSGTFELSWGEGLNATILVQKGCPAKVRTSEPVHYLGTVMSELGMISAEQLDASLSRMQESPRLQGEILLEMGAIDPAGIDAALRSQVERKIEHLFGLPAETTFAYFDELDVLARYGGPATPIDPFPVLWRGVRERPSLEHVESTLRRIGGASFRAAAAAQFNRFSFGPDELRVVAKLADRAIGVADITETLGDGPGRTFAYFLTIMKQVDLLDLPAPAAPTAPAETPSQVPPPSSSTSSIPEPASSTPSRLSGGGIPMPPSSGQAFARLQLRQAARGPLVVEERVSPPAVHDPRASVPGMPKFDAAAHATTTASSVPSVPPPPTVTESAPPSPKVARPPQPSAPETAPALTAEQNALKAKIVSRAELISSEDYFQMLGVAQDTPVETIQKAFIALAKVWHPDRLPPALMDVKDACSKVFAHLTEAHATLTDTSKRGHYATLLRDGGASPDDQAKIQEIVEAATEFQKAEFLLKRNSSDPKAYEIVARCVELDDQPDYVATLAWLEAQKPDCQAREKVLEKIAILDKCIQRSPRSERAHFFRGMLHKRTGDTARALEDFKFASELNPRNLDAMREVRVHNMRQPGAAGKPAANTAKPATSPRASKPPPSEKRSEGLFGKLFKK